MPFKPSEEQEYFIIAKHSGKALGVVTDDLGSQLKQVKYNPEDARQKFKFAKGADFFWIMMRPYKEHFLAVHNHSQNDGVPVLMWKWEPNEPFLQFHIEPAYDGYYRIKARHSQKFLDVQGSSTEDGTGVVQNGLGQVESQLFCFVPAVDKPVGSSPITYIEQDNLLRTGILTAVGKIPEAGEALSFIVGLFWEEKTLTDFWDQMKNYVDKRIREFMVEAQLKNLRENLEGLLAELAEIKALPGKQGANIQKLILDIKHEEPHFFNQPKEVLPYLVSLGTIMMTLRRMMVVNYETLFGIDPAKDREAAAAVAVYKTLLTQSIKDYTKAIEKSKKELLAWRLSLIPQKHDEINTQGSQTEYKSTIRDGYDGWTASWYYFTTGTGVSDYKARCQFAREQRYNMVQVQYAMEIEELLHGARYWKYYEIGATPYIKGDKLLTVGTYGGPYATNTFKGANVGLTGVDIFTKDGVLCGLEVFYTNRESFGLKGSKGNGSASLKLAHNEYITSINLYADLVIEGIWFTTQRGRTVGGGSTSEARYNADLPAIFNPRLAVISGAWNGDTIEQLSFDWLVTE